VSTQWHEPTDRPADEQRELGNRRANGSRRVLLLTVLGIMVPAVLVGALLFSGEEPRQADLAAGTAVRAEVPAGGDSRESGAVTIGAPVPAFEVTTVSGETFQMPSGEPTILTFVNLCPTCIQDVRTVGELQKQFGNVTVLAVASDPTADAATLTDFVDQAGDFDFTLALDPQTALTERFDAFSKAGSVVVADAEGTVTYRGPADREALQTALQAAGAAA
jgi:peroxiredoxin